MLNWLAQARRCRRAGVRVTHQQLIGMLLRRVRMSEVLEAVAIALGLPPAARDASAAILREHGNMSSATVPFILERLLRDGAPRPILALAFGPGLTGEALLLTEQP